MRNNVCNHACWFTVPLILIRNGCTALAIKCVDECHILWRATRVKGANYVLKSIKSVITIK